MNVLDELNGDLTVVIDNECKNEERRSDCDNNGEDERAVSEIVSVDSKMKKKHIRT